jgi:hypothetical protein
MARGRRSHFVQQQFVEADGKFDEEHASVR